jgi:hypothetical protein
VTTTATPLGRPSWSRTASIEDYGGSLTKHDSETEGEISYAVMCFLEWRDNLRGSAYTKEEGTLVHVENVALGRFFGCMMRWADRLRNNRQPSLASDSLADWVKILAVPTRPSDTDTEIRAACAAKARGRLGPTRQVVDDSFAELLGDLFIQVWRIDGPDIATPPDLTYWPGVNPGPASYDLGGGAWLSERCHLVIEVTGPQEMQLSEYYYLLNGKLLDLARRILPAYVTCDWAVNVAGGFELDIDDLDFGSLG